MTTAAGSATTIVDTKLAQLSADDDFCVGWYVRNVATGQIRLVTNYVASTTTITHVSMTAVGNAATYELHRLDPTMKHNALGRASILTAPGPGRRGLYLALRNETLIVDNLILNPSFEVNTSGPIAFTNWTNIGTPTLTAETSRKVHLTQAAGIAATDTTEGLEQNLFTTVNYEEVVAKTLHVRGWVFATVASAARLRVTFDGTTYTNGPWQGGDAEWEDPGTQYIDVSIPADATEMTVSCEVTNGNTAYFDLVTAYIDPINRYTLPTTMTVGPHQVLMQSDLSRPDGNYFPLPAWGAVSPNRVLRLIGETILSQPSTDAGTVEIGGAQVELFIAHAARWLYRALLQGGSQQERDYLAKLKADWDGDIARLEQTPGVAMPSTPAHMHKGAWHVEEDSSGRYLCFDVAR